MLTLECVPKDPTQFQESCEFIGVPPTAPSPTIDCGSNEIAVSCDSCAEAFCCDSGKVSTNIHFSKHDVVCSVACIDLHVFRRQLKDSWGCQNGMMRPALGCDLSFLKVCSNAKCVCDVANGYARAPDGTCVKGSACQQFFGPG